MSEPMTDAELYAIEDAVKESPVTVLRIIDALRESRDEVRRLRDGYADLVEAARDVCEPVRPSEAVEAQLRARLARIDELEKGGA